MMVMFQPVCFAMFSKIVAKVSGSLLIALQR